MRGGRRAAAAAAVGEGGGTEEEEEEEEKPTIQATPVSGFTFRLLKIRNLLAIVLDLNPSFLKQKNKAQHNPTTKKPSAMREEEKKKEKKKGWLLR
jgi:hypothetical protein